MPGARCARGRAWCVVNTRVSHHGHTGKRPAFPAQSAPYGKKLDAQGLVHCLLDAVAAKEACGPMSSFFGDAQPELQIAFVQMHGITKAQLIAAAKTSAAHSGQSYPLAA
jgi:hypothetical protein